MAHSSRSPYVPLQTMTNIPASNSQHTLWSDKLWLGMGHGLVLSRFGLYNLLGELTEGDKADGQYLFAHFAESGATPALAEHTVCYGRRCFDGALWIAAAGSLTAAIGFFLIGRRWKV